MVCIKCGKEIVEEESIEIWNVWNLIPSGECEVDGSAYCKNCNETFAIHSQPAKIDLSKIVLQK